MFKDGYGAKYFVNIDISPTVCEQMAKRPLAIKHSSLFHYKAMDCRDMSPLQSSYYNLIVDKGGFDALEYGSTFVEDMKAMLSHIWRLLAPGGKYIVITCGDPARRLKYFTQDPSHTWSIQCDIIVNPNLSKPNEFNFYVLTKPSS